MTVTVYYKISYCFCFKVIRQISSTLGYESTHDFIKTHIGRIIDSWLNHGFKLADFPFQAAEFKSLADFLRLDLIFLYLL